jgi:hypothetical protein
MVACARTRIVATGEVAATEVSVSVTVSWTVVFPVDGN